MNVELNKPEIELLDQALEVWEKEENSTALMGAVISAVLCPPEKRDEVKLKQDEDFRKAKEVTAQRRMKAIMLRAKLLQAVARNSEHDLEPATP